MISYNIKSHNIITKLQICIIFLQPLILWPVGSNSRRRRRRLISRIMFGIAASETWTKRVCEAVVETRDEGLCLAGERSEIRRSSSSWGANLLHHHGAAGSIIHHSKSYKTLPTSNTWMAGVSEMHSGFQGLWTRNFQAWFTKKALVGDDDTIMFITHNMVQVLFKYNHTQPFYVGYAGYASKIHCQNIIFSYEMAFGGAGYAISHPFAKELAKIQDSCIQRCCNTFPQNFSLVQGYLSCLV